MFKNTLMLLLLFLNANIFASEQELSYEKYLIATVGDFIQACEPIIKPNALANDDFYNSLSCLSYTSGVISGYTSTLSLSAEYQLADEMSTSRSEIISQIKSDPTRHKQFEEYTATSQFLCFNKKVGLVDIIKHIVNSLKDKNIDLNHSVHYVILNEIERLLPCSKN